MTFGVAAPGEALTSNELSAASLGAVEALVALFLYRLPQVQSLLCRLRESAPQLSDHRRSCHGVG